MKVIIYIIFSLIYVFKGIKIKRRESYIDNNEDVPAKSLFIKENEHKKENNKIYFDDYEDSQMFNNQVKYDKSSNNDYYDDLNDYLLSNQTNKEKLDTINEYTDDLFDENRSKVKGEKQDDKYIDNLKENKSKDISKYRDDLKDNNFFVAQKGKKDNLNQYRDNLNDWNEPINHIQKTNENIPISQENPNQTSKVQNKTQSSIKEEFPTIIKEEQKYKEIHQNHNNHNNLNIQQENSINKINQPIKVLKPSEQSFSSTVQPNATTSSLTNINIVIKPSETENRNKMEEDDDTKLLKQLNNKLGELLYKKQVNNVNQQDGNLENKLLELLSSIVNKPGNLSRPSNNKPPQKIHNLLKPFPYYHGNNNFQSTFPYLQSLIPQSNIQNNFLSSQHQPQLNINYQPVPSFNNYQVIQPQINPQSTPLRNNSLINQKKPPYKYEKYNKMFKKLKEQIKELQNNIKSISYNDKQENNNYYNSNQSKEKEINIIQPIIQRLNVEEAPLPIPKPMIALQPPPVIQTQFKPIPPQYTYYKIYNRN